MAGHVRGSAGGGCPHSLGGRTALVTGHVRGERGGRPHSLGGRTALVAGLVRGGGEDEGRCPLICQEKG